MRRMSSARRGPLAAAVSVAIGCLLLGGCSGSDPGPAPTTMHPGTAATTTATPSGNPTDIAAAAAIAAVQKLYAEYNAMLKSGSSRDYRRTFTKACRYCSGNANRVDQIHRKGQKIFGGSVRLTNLRPAEVRDRLAVIEGTMIDSPVTVKQGDRVVDRFAGGGSVLFTWIVELSGANSWLVTDEQVPR
jgi:hypothetical protein